MRRFSRTFITGLAVILPIAATLYVLYWLGRAIQVVFDPVARRVLPAPAGEWPLVGIALGVVLVFGTGLLMKLWVVRIAFHQGERVLSHVPLVKTLYGSVRDLMGFFQTVERAQKPLRQAVAIELDALPGRLVGLVTREDFSDLPDELGTEETVAVYLPMSYQIGGYTLLVPRSAVRPLGLSTEELMRFAVTAGVSRYAPEENPAKRTAVEGGDGA